MIPELVTVHTSLLTDLGDAIRARFGVGGDKTLTELKEIVLPSLPSEYQQVDYIESSGTQYIDTGVKPDKFTAVKLDYQFATVPTGNKYLYGASVNGDLIQFFGIYIDNSRAYCRQTWGGRDGTNYYYYSPNTSRVTASFGGSQFFLREGNNDYYLIRYGSGVSFDDYFNTANLSIYLLANNQSGTAVNNSAAKAFGCQIFNGFTGQIYRDFIPCYRKSDNEIGLYDVIGQQFYTNAGSGSFTCYPAPPSN